MANYGINGFGRIGRNVLRAMTQQQVERVRAINDLTDTKTLAHLLKWDSVHGKFDGEIGFDEENIIVRGHKIRIFKERDPGNLPWRKLDVDVVLESTGFFTARDKAELHISKAGAKRVLISAPAKNPDATLCIGINDNVYDPAKHTIVSNASCTTNCLAPLAKVLHDKFGIAHGFMSTIHSYTNDQRILDFPHEDLRRARAAAISIIPSSTGAAKAIGEVIPDLKGKLNGGAFRVPTLRNIRETPPFMHTGTVATLAEAHRLGFQHAIVPCSTPDVRGMRLQRVADLDQALDATVRGEG